MLKTRIPTSKEGVSASSLEVMKGADFVAAPLPHFLTPGPSLFHSRGKNKMGLGGGLAVLPVATGTLLTPILPPASTSPAAHLLRVIFPAHCRLPQPRLLWGYRYLRLPKGQTPAPHPRPGASLGLPWPSGAAVTQLCCFPPDYISAVTLDQGFTHCQVPRPMPSS